MNVLAIQQTGSHLFPRADHRSVADGVQPHQLLNSLRFAGHHRVSASARPQRTGRAWLRAASAFLVLSVVAALCACNGQGGDPGRSASASPSPSATAAQENTARSAALAAYTGMWAAFAQAGETADYESPALQRYATGEALQTLVDGLKSNKQNGYVYRGRPTLRPRVTALVLTSQPYTASIVDCADTTNWNTYDKAGRPNDAEAGRRHITATVTQQNGAWKVSTFAVELADTC